MTHALSSMLSVCHRTSKLARTAAVDNFIHTGKQAFAPTSTRALLRDRHLSVVARTSPAVVPADALGANVGERRRAASSRLFSERSGPNESSLHPVPLPAVAFEFYDDDTEENNLDFVKTDDDTSSTVPTADGSCTNPTLNRNPGGNISSAPSPLSQKSQHIGGPSSPRRGVSGGGGGGAGGRYRCPKCGSYVSFRHEDFEENTFYCATCSGWFLVTTTAKSEAIAAGSDVSREHSDDSTVSGSKDEFTERRLLAMSFNPEELKQRLKREGQQPSNGRDEEQEDGRTERIPEKDSFDESRVSGNQRRRRAKEHIPTPVQICRGLDEYVIGQQNVKIALSVGVYNHYKRVEMAEANAMRAAAKKAAVAVNDDLDEDGDVDISMDGIRDGASLSDLNLSHMERSTHTVTSGVMKGFCEASVDSIESDEDSEDTDLCELDKSNIIIIGPTGSGKTLLVKTLARFIDVPIVIADATCLTQAGYVGEDVESILLKLYHEAGQDLERCQKGIVYLDEADKIRKSGGNISISRDVSGEGVQHALLKIVEGNVINVPKEPGRKNPRGDFLAIDTTNILFICGGAFSGLERIINRRMDAASIGFGAQMKKELDDHNVQGRYFDNAIPRDLIDYGMIPEFVGRFPVIESTRGLDVQNLIDILTVPKNSLIKQYNVLFGKDGVNFHVTDCALEEIAKIAHTRGSGARGLRSITENILMETMFVVPSISKCHTVFVDAEAVRGERKPVLLKHPDMTVEKYEALKHQGMHEGADGAEPVYVGEQSDRYCEGFGQAAA